MRNIVAIPLLGLAVIVQSAIVGQFSLLAGYADLLLVILAAWALQEGVTTAFQWAFLASVMISFVSHLPWIIYFIGYFGVVFLALLLAAPHLASAFTGNGQRHFSGNIVHASFVLPLFEF